MRKDLPAWNIYEEICLIRIVLYIGRTVKRSGVLGSLIEKV